MCEAEYLVVVYAGRSRTLLVSFLSRFAFIFSMQAMPPLFPMVMTEFKVSFTTMSSLLWLVAVPGLFLSVLGGLLTEKYGVRSILTVGLLICVASSVLILFSNLFVILQFCQLLLGVGGALAVVSASTLLFQWFEKEKLGLAMGVFGFCMPAGTVAAFNSLGVFADSHGWRASILIVVAVNLFALLACLLLTKEKDSARPGKVTLAPFRNVNIWILGLGWALFNMAVLGFTTWGKTIFVRYYDLPMEFSGLLASMIMLGALVQPLTGHVSDILGQRRSLVVVSCIVIFMIFLLFPYVPSTYLLPITFTLGLLVAFVPPPLFVTSGKILGPGNGALGLGVMNTFLNFGIILGPLTLGYVLDVTNSNFFTFLTMASFALLSAILIAAHYD